MKVGVVILLLPWQVFLISNAESTSTRIIGGENAFAGQFPYAAAIYKTTAKGNYFCVGSLLNRNWVITAGQCVDEATLFTILLGTHTLDGTGEYVLKESTSHYVLHPDYNATTLENDIGLIKFRMSITYNDYIRNIYLPYRDLQESFIGIAVGWGQITDDDSQLSNTLQRVSLTAIPNDECKITYGDQISENMKCFVGSYNEGTCFGDSGSPVIQSIGRAIDVVIAISSFFSAKGCESTDPSGYTNVWPYTDWINGVINS